MSSLRTADPSVAAFADEVGAEGPVAVEGARTRWELGGPLDPAARIVRAPSGIVDHQPDEMTVSVRAGSTVADLHAELAAAGQRTSLPERAGTVGGAIAVGESHVEALGRGPVRDAVLQLRYVSASGEVVTAGGPTVKNVTGYNLPKLLVGSLGTLGLVAEVTLRTDPIPARSSWVASDDADPFAVPGVVLAPSAVLWGGSRTWVHLEGHAADVAAERTTLGTIGAWSDVDAPPPLPPHRWSLAPAELTDLGAAHGAFVAAIGVGLVHATHPQPPRELPAAVRTVARRMKDLFDPTGRLNPGRDPEAR